MRIPSSTYRVQFNDEFSFRDALALVPKLHRLGISHLYCSPIFAARQGSSHGYDVVDPNRLNPALGTSDDFDALLEALRSREMGAIIDIVPNHMAANPENRWWMDVLESGSASQYAGFFGVQWSVGAELARGKIFLPILGDHYANVLDKGELKLTYRQEGMFVEYWDHRFPVSPAMYHDVLEPNSASLSHVPEFELMMDIMERMPPGSATEWDSLESREREKEEIKLRLWELYSNRYEVKEHVDRNLQLFSGTPGDPASFDRLHALLEQQAYRLAFWQVATERINYRRFFDVTDLIGVRVEDPAVMRTTHQFISSLVDEGKVDGLRVDHIDGLADPEGYLERLPHDKTYVVVEKILVGDERLPSTWRVQGSSGYDFLGYLNAFFVEPAGFEAIEKAYRSQTGFTASLSDVEYERKLHIMDSLFPGEMEDLGAALGMLAEQDRYARDLSPRHLSRGIRQITACMPVYRSYTRAAEIVERDAQYLRHACSEAARRAPDVDPLVFDFIGRVLQLRFHASLAPAERDNWAAFVRRWQQLTGPIMAKGVEDSTFYVYNPLISLNEVGGIHETVGCEQMHRFLGERGREWPHTMNGTSTHDTKRSEDVRARINTLPEFAGEWARLASRWSRWMRDRRDPVDLNEEWFLFQTLVGAWPLFESEVDEFRQRMKTYSTKAAREARQHTSWLSPSQEHEEALHRFIDVLFTDTRFLSSFLPFQQKTAFYGAVNSLAQLMIKTTAPGLPDFYRGTLGWDFSLVDPDNRRPVVVPDLTDFAESPRVLLENWRDGRVKVFLTEKVLAFRRVHPELFEQGDYVPLSATGKRANNVFGFARSRNNEWAVSITPRFSSQLAAVLRFPTGVPAWRDTVLQLPEGAPSRWRNVLTGARYRIEDGRLPLHRILESFPVGLLVAR